MLNSFVCSEIKADAPGTWRKIPPPEPEAPKPAAISDNTMDGDDNDGFSEVKPRSSGKKAAKQVGPASKNGISQGGAKKDYRGQKGERPGDRGDRARSTAPKTSGGW